jgi:hypothetical protein
MSALGLDLSSYPALHTVVVVLGLLVLAKIAYFFGSLVWRRLLRPATDLRKYGAKSGGWAGTLPPSDPSCALCLHKLINFTIFILF